MNDPQLRLNALREAFDAAFAMPVAAPRDDHERLVAIRASGEPYALRLAELGGLVAAPGIVPLAGAPDDCLGVAGLRGRLVPVFDLGRLLGHPAAAPRWLALVNGAEPAAFAFTELEGYREAPPEAFVPAAHGPAGHPVTTLWTGEPPRGVIDLPRLLKTLARVAGAAAPDKEMLS